MLDQLNIAISATRLPLIKRYVAMGLGIALLVPRKAKFSRPKLGESEVLTRDVSHLFGHEELVILQRKGRFELSHVKAFRELVEAEFKAEKKS